MVKTKTNKMHLEITNDVELNVEGTSTSKLNEKSIEAKSMKNPKTNSIKFSKAGRITKKRGPSKRRMTSSKAPRKGKTIPLKSITKKSMKSKPVAFKQGKTVSMRSHPQKTSMKSKPVALKQGETIFMRSQLKKASIKSKPVFLKHTVC